MFWIFPALGSYLSWAFLNIIDKYAVTKRVKSPSVYYVWMVWLGLMVVVVIPFIDFYVPSTNTLWWIFVASGLYFFGSLLYLQAMKIEEVSRVNFWWNLIPLFTLLFAWLFLDEALNAREGLAFVILIAGAVVASLRFRDGSMLFSRALLWMIASTALYALSYVAIRFIAQDLPFLLASVWLDLALILWSFAPFFLKRFRILFAEEWRRLTPKLVGVVASASFFDGLGKILNVWAISLAAVALVAALEGSQSVFVFFLAVIISVFAPRILKEELDRRNVMIKLIALALMAAGVAVLSFA